jgi:hypothetical protein
MGSTPSVNSATLQPPREQSVFLALGMVLQKLGNQPCWDSARATGGVSHHGLRRRYRRPERRQGTARCRECNLRSEKRLEVALAQPCRNLLVR